jgi:secondary thiamine-phosphate synthase enzyme
MGMKQVQTIIDIRTNGAGLYEFSGAAQRLVAEAGIGTGMLHVFCRHTSCSLLVQENADPDVQTDLNTFFRRLVPEGMEWVVHTTEGPDDMPAHIKAALTQSSISIPVGQGELLLGTWQGIYLFEHRTRPHRRQVVLHLVGE